MIAHLERSFAKLMDYCEKQGYKGYDPYDAQNSFLPIDKLPHTVQFVITQVNKKSPINFRSILGINRNFHSKAMGLFLAGYCNMLNITQDKQKYNKLDFFINWFERNSSKYSKNLCWGFDYNYASRKENINKGFPTIIHHSYIIQSLYKCWLLTGSEKIFKLINASKYFILNDIPVSNYSDGICFGYHPNSIGCCYNASLHAAECLAIVDKINNKDEYFVLIKKAVQYVLSKQKTSGEWYYSHGLIPEKEKKQIDFHQGFILDCLRSIDNLTGGRLNSIVNPAIETGLEFYYSKQFNEYGKGCFRYPKKYPTDIHNQAQGIITFSRFSDYDPKFKMKAASILSWTIQNMQDEKGYFYYQKYRFFRNNLSYIRWSQAWMFFAISEYLLMMEPNKND